MNKHTLIGSTLAILLCLFSLCLSAETVTLKNGKTITGQILVQNEEVVIIRDANGARHQYPAGDVLSVSQNKETNVEAEPVTTNQPSVAPTSKKAILLLELAGGALYENTHSWGGYAAADLLIGSRQLMGRSITLGGSVGYMGAFTSGHTYHFLPISLAMRVPLIEGKHAPVLGANVGYGVGLSKNYKGGLAAGLDIAYRYTPNTRTTIQVGLNVRFQQTTIPVIETIEKNSFTNTAGRNLVAIGAKLGVSF